MQIVDLRSDTVTRPTPAMREAMARAEVGDDVYGEDPSVNALEERAAALLGKEAALFVPSGTMANQLALGTLAGPGDEVICDQGAHCANFEGGALSALWGIQPRPLPGRRGILDGAQVEAAIRPANDHYPRTRVVALENTHNRGGGAVWPLEAIQAVCAVAARHRLEVYVDGARLLNAQVATGTDAREYAAGAAMVSLCFSKGLGAPAGSVLAGPRDLVRTARRLRKRLGGAMRQAGILAAAATFALDHHVARLAEDHRNARELAGRLAALGAEIPHPIDTNLIFAAFPGRSAPEAARLFREAGVLCNPEGSRPDLLRFVTHLDVSAADVDLAAGRIERALRGG